MDSELHYTPGKRVTDQEGSLGSSVTIQLQSAQLEDKPILQHLLQLCLHDYSEFNDQEINENGLFDYSYLDFYWTEPGRFPVLVRVEGKLAGFLLVRQLERDSATTLWQMAEFFILRKYRRQGIGRRVAHRVFDQFEGKWQVTQEEGNWPAQTFWRRVIEEYQQLNPGRTFQ